MQAGLTEIIDLSKSDQQRLWAEVASCCEVVRQQFACDKLNVAAIGNVVRLTLVLKLPIETVPQRYTTEQEALTRSVQTSTFTSQQGCTGTRHGLTRCGASLRSGAGTTCICAWDRSIAD